MKKNYTLIARIIATLILLALLYLRYVGIIGTGVWGLLAVLTLVVFYWVREKK